MRSLVSLIASTLAKVSIGDKICKIKKSPIWESHPLPQPSEPPRLDELLVDDVLPKKGRLSKADRDREQGETFAAMRRQHPAVESAINNLEHRGLDRVRSKGREGFARTVVLSVVALNVHRLGRLLRQQARDRFAA